MKIAGVNRLCASSNANVMPVSGALNATASPAHAPPGCVFAYITVTLFARFLGLSGSNPRHKDAVSASDCKGITDKTGYNKSSLFRGNS